MKTVNTSPISGMQELSPEKQAHFDYLKSKIDETYKSHGFLKIETPIIERSEILFAKAGEDTEKQIYKVIKTAESAEDSTQALRFDHTVPLARYIVEHENSLTFPFKVSQIGRNFRGERAQKGRFREFYQCDIDIIGRNSLPITYDADVIATLLSTLKAFKLKTPILARISNRKILSGLLEAMNLQSQAKDIYSIIDHSEKVPPEKTKQNFEELGLGTETISKLLSFIEINGSCNEATKQLNSLGVDNPTFSEGIAELTTILSLLESIGLENNVQVDMKIVRGLDYYTGTVFEFILPEHKEIGSICGGGRYDNLTGYFSEQSFPGVGGSIGLTRLFYILNERHLLEDVPATPIEYAIIPISSSEHSYCFKLADVLRDSGHSATVVLTDKKLGDKLSYSAKIAKNGIVIGEEEVKTSKLQTKDFTTGTTKTIDINTVTGTI